MTDPLKPCPICGHFAEPMPQARTAEEQAKTDMWAVVCMDEFCLTRGPAMKGKGASITAWNRRQGDGSAALREALKLMRSLVNEGGVPRYTVTPGAALNTLIEEVVDPLLGLTPDREAK